MSIKFVMFSAESWQSRLESLFHLLDNSPTFHPEKWGISEPVRKEFQAEYINDMEKLWNERLGIMFQRRTFPKLWINIEWWKKAGNLNRLSLGIEDSYFKKSVEFEYLDFCIRLFNWGQAMYGYCCHDNDFENKNVLDEPTLVNGRLIKVGGAYLEDGLPGIYWMNFFGKIYVNWLGKEKLLSAISYDTRVINSEAIILLSSPSPLDYAKPEVQELTVKMLHHLGQDVFFEKQNPTKICRTPF